MTSTARGNRTVRPITQRRCIRSSCEPDNGDWGDKAIQAYLVAGVPPDKLLLGVPFYGHGWRGVAAVNYGLCQPAAGLARGVYERAPTITR